MMMEVDGDPAMAMEESSNSMPFSPGGASTCSNKSRGRKTEQKPYNRSTVPIETIYNNPKDITAKTMRVLLPMMVQKGIYPEKDLKCKVKGLWQLGNKPRDLPSNIDWKDPNNSPKMSNEMMKDFFRFMKEKLFTEGVYPRIQVLYQPSTAYQSRRSLLDTTVKSDVGTVLSVKSPMSPLLIQYYDGTDIQTQVKQEPQSARVMEQPPTFNIPQYVPPCSPALAPLIPSTVDEMGQMETKHLVQERDDDARTRRELDVQPPSVTPVREIPASRFQVNDTYMEPPGATPVIATLTETANVETVSMHRDSDGYMIYDLAVVHSVSPPGESTITITHDDTAQPVVIQDEQNECVKITQQISQDLNAPLAEFQKMFQGDFATMDRAHTALSVVNDLYRAGMEGDREKCLELSEFCSQLRTIIQTNVFQAKLNANPNPEPALAQLIENYMEKTRRRVNQAQIVPDDVVPPVDNEVQVYQMESHQAAPRGVFTSASTLSGQDHYIPTVQGLRQRSLVKQQLLNDPQPTDTPWLYTDDSSKAKVLVEINPHPEALVGINSPEMNSSNLDPEEQFGVKLIEADPVRLDVQSFIDKEMARKERKALIAANANPAVTMTTTVDNYPSQPATRMITDILQQSLVSADIQLPTNAGMVMNDDFNLAKMMDLYDVSLGEDVIESTQPQTEVTMDSQINSPVAVPHDDAMEINVLSPAPVTTTSVVYPVPLERTQIPRVLEKWNTLYSATTIPLTVADAADGPDIEFNRTKRRSKAKGSNAGPVGSYTDSGRR